MELPDLVLLKVFSFLGNEEKIKRLMLVCKRWRSLMQSDIQQLAIYRSKEPPYRLFWGAFSEEEIDHKYIVRTNGLTEKIIRFANLKKLFLYKVTYPLLDSFSDGSLDQLVELKIIISSRPFYERSDEHPGPSSDPSLASELKSEKMNLPSLKKLCSNWAFDLNEFAVPNLESIAFEKERFNQEVDYPEKIKFILCERFETNQIFSNLEHLVCRRIKGVLPLEAMPKLKRVELFPLEMSDFETIENLRMQKDLLERSDLFIWVAGLKGNFTRELVECFWRMFYFDEDFFEPRVNPYDHIDYNEPLCVVPWKIVLSSPYLTRKFPNLEGIPSNFFNIFIDVQEMRISGVQVNGENLIRLIKMVKNIESLKISGSRFNETFFHELSQIQTIQILHLQNVFPLNASDFDIGFMFDLQNVWLLQIQDTLPQFRVSTKRLVEFLRTNLKNTASLDISHEKKFVDITHSLRYNFHYEGNEDDRGLDFDSLDELISCMENIARSTNTIFYLES